MSLRPPPKTETPSRIVARFLTLIVLLGAVGVVIYTAVTNQRADLTENRRLVNLDLEGPIIVDGFIINVVEDPGGPAAVVILHDFDVTGGLILSDLSASLGARYHGVRLDLPGFGLSTRMPGEGPQHTVAGLSERMATAIEERFDESVLVVGVGLGGEVGAELALNRPDLVAGLVMVDVDFWASDPFVVGLQRLPWIGKAATFTWETGGRLSLENWAPYCGEGGWCPGPEQAFHRESIVLVEGTTESLHGFRRTRHAASASANLTRIEPPVAYVWSTEGRVPRATVDRLRGEILGLAVVESETFQAHLEDPAAVAAALEAVDR
jgi:pimeloyl-ACP methyl ester carboxylesterase